MKKKKTRKGAYKPTLITGECVPITDPAVQAALDELRKMDKPVFPQILRDYSDARARLMKAQKA